MQVLVVDDSAVVRQVMTTLLSQAGMEVRIAADPLIAMSKIKAERPDVILLDVEMPRMDGLTFLHTLMASDPIPVVICSSLAGRGTDIAMRALREGALAVVEKPKFGVRDFLQDSAATLIETLRGAAKARVGVKHTASSPAQTLAGAQFATTDKVIVMGASIGGTEALRFLLEALPVDMPGIVVVQHMPQAFTAAFAKHLNETCKLDVKEAEDGDRIMNGRVLIAPGNLHTYVRRSGAHYVVEVSPGDLVCHHRPSVELLFRSTATAAGASAIGVILTGMGNDGAEGLLHMRAAGAHTLAQDEASSVVFGMAKEAIARGAVHPSDVLPLSDIPAALIRAMRVRA